MQYQQNINRILLEYLYKINKLQIRQLSMTRMHLATRTPCFFGALIRSGLDHLFKANMPPIKRTKSVWEPVAEVAACFDSSTNSISMTSWKDRHPLNYKQICSCCDFEAAVGAARWPLNHTNSVWYHSASVRPFFAPHGNCIFTARKSLPVRGCNLNCIMLSPHLSPVKITSDLSVILLNLYCHHLLWNGFLPCGPPADSLSHKRSVWHPTPSFSGNNSPQIIIPIAQGISSFASTCRVDSGSVHI